MKQFFVLLLLTLTLGHNRASACGGEITYNYYLFDVLDGTFCQDRQVEQRCDQFWKEYTNGKVTEYQWHAEEVMEFAKNRNDQEMVAYLAELNKYLDICSQLKETWDYPTKEQLEERAATLKQMTTIASSYRGKRLRSQWALLYMRANMVQKQHQTNVNYWNTTASKLPDNVYREMMENIYAGALLHTGHRQEAIEIFSRQGDLCSVRWLMRKHRNLDGIKSVYAEDPASPSLPFLVQDFVNNAQETIDETDEKKNIDEDRLKEIDARVITKKDCDDFIRFARQVIRTGKTPCPALWQAAIGELQYLNGDAKTAFQTLTEALSMNGSQKMLENARAIRIVAASKAKFQDNDFAQWMSGEINWLYDQTVANAGDDDCRYTHYLALERLIHMELAPRYKASGNVAMSTALYAMLDSYEEKRVYSQESEETSDWNIHYASWHGYNDELNYMTAAQLESYVAWYQKTSNDELEQWVKEHIKFDARFFDDMIGTHYLAEGQFAAAVPYLKRVPISFLEGQNISYYLAHRDFTRPRWFGRQAFKESIQTDGAHLAHLSDNPKLRFCEEMIRLQSAYDKARGTERQRLALQLAVRYYQASYKGDCWYLCRYGHSTYDSAEKNEMDFVEVARKLLRESAQSTDFDIRQESLFALAFIPSSLGDEGSFWGDVTDWTTVIPNRNQQDLSALKSFYQQNKSRAANYVRRCDVLKAYMSM